MQREGNVLDTGLEGRCVVCLGELEPGRTVGYCSSSCRGLVRAYTKARRADLATAIHEKRAATARAAGFESASQLQQVLTLDAYYAASSTDERGVSPVSNQAGLQCPRSYA